MKVLLGFGEGSKLKKRNRELSSRVMDLELQNENLRQAKRQRISDARSWKEKHARLLVRHANAEETRQAQIAYMESDEFKQQTARSWVLGHIRRDDSDDQTARYKNAFKTNYAMFSQDCISNAKTARGATRLLDACGLPGIKMPARSTLCMFKIIEGEGNLVEWLQSGKITLFGINTDGSKRGDKDFYEVILYGWNEQSHAPEWRIVTILDMGSHGDAETIGNALLWTIREKTGLDPVNWVMAVSDNTNSMSGTGPKQKKAPGPEGVPFFARDAL